jgi:membrane-associated protein
MESLYTFVCAHAQDAYWIFFLLLLLAGLNIPISEDILLLTGGALASTCLTLNEAYLLYIWIYFGCWFSAWEAYWIGRLLGPKLYGIPWFNHFVTPKRIIKLHHLYEKWGILTFIVGRFIPGGVRNALFITSGLGKMPFLKFIMRDAVACLIASSTIFYLGYIFGENYSVIVSYIKKYELAVIFILLTIILTFIFITIRNRSKKNQANS